MSGTFEENQATVFLDSFENAPSSYRLKQKMKEHKNESNFTESDAKKEIADEITIGIRRQALLYGRIVITDSSTYNNFLFPEMEKEDFKAFCKNCSSLFISRHRKPPIVEGLYGKDYNIRDYWSKELQMKTNELGKKMKVQREKTGKPVLVNDTGKELAEKFAEMDPQIESISDFEKLKEFLIRCDKFKDVLDKKKKYVDYGKGPNTKVSMEKNVDNLLVKIGQFASIFGKNHQSIKDLENLVKPEDLPNFSAIETAIRKLEEDTDGLDDDYDKKFIKSQLNDFYMKDFHENIALFGMASQHECDSLEQALEDAEYTLDSNYVCGIIPEPFKHAIEQKSENGVSSWTSFNKMFKENESKRNALSNALCNLEYHQNSEEIIKLIRNLLGKHSDVCIRDGFKMNGVISRSPTTGKPTHIIDLKKSLVAYRIRP
jgi:hypothetical protein